MNILSRIDSPKDIKALGKEELVMLSNEVRDAIIHKVSVVGGHVGSNLGIVEMSVALHYVFDSPKDKIVFDVSHQCYAHKILTGRKEAFLDELKYTSVTGFTNPKESEHDIFAIGHTSTSVSLACGLAKARDVTHQKESIVAVIGDGSLSGGEAFEGLNNAAELTSNLIIIVNDNDMSIAENHGGIYQNLKLLRDSEGEASNNLFKAIGLDYYFVKDGHNLEELISMFQKVKELNHPVVVHVCTEKGKGLSFAQEEKEKWHYRAPFDKVSGQLKQTTSQETYAQITTKYLNDKMQQDESLVVISAATPTIGGYDEKLRSNLQQYTDVGIAEAHAIAYASGICRNGGKAVLSINSSFVQRAYDQISQDMALNNTSGVILVFNGGIQRADQTHLGIFDIPLISNIPNIEYLAPTNKEEYLAMLDWAVDQNECPIAIRVPLKNVVSKSDVSYSSLDEIKKYQTIVEGKEVAILALGGFFQHGENVCASLKEKYNIEATLINPQSITTLDQPTLDALKKNHQIVVTLEDGCLAGGFGEKIARYYGPSEMKVINFGAKKEFYDRTPIEELYARNHLSVDAIVNDIYKVYTQE